MFINECGDGVYIPPSEEPQEPKVTVTSTEEVLHQLEVIRTRIENTVNFEVNLKDLSIEEVESDEGTYYSVKYNGEEWGQIPKIETTITNAETLPLEIIKTVTGNKTDYTLGLKKITVEREETEEKVDYAVKYNDSTVGLVDVNNRTVGGKVSGKYAEASGVKNSALAENSLALGGNDNTAQADNSAVVGGEGNIVDGLGNFGAVVGGSTNWVGGESSAAIGGDNLLTTHDKTVVIGEYNKDEDMAFIIGNGTSNERSNCFSVSRNGDINGLSLKLGDTNLSETQLKTLLAGGGDLTPKYYDIYTDVEGASLYGVAYTIGPVLHVEIVMGFEEQVAKQVALIKGLPEALYATAVKCYDTLDQNISVIQHEGSGEIYTTESFLGGTELAINYITLVALPPEITAPGLRVNYRTSTFTRLGAAEGLSAGSDFDKFTMYGGRKKCNVADDGTINAWYGDDTYTEDGTNGQVMVYQPKFYYMVIPYEIDPIEDQETGYHLRDAAYYVSDKKLAGFKLHPAFYDANGNEVDFILTSAYEGCIYDTSESAYISDDSQVMDASADKFSSIAGVKPASGLTQNLTRVNIEAMAQNRGTNWHGDLIKTVSAEQLLMIIELGAMNTQSAIAQGVTLISDNSAYNCSSLTGSTASLGNGTGMAESTVNTQGDTTTTETANGKTAICWRGKENFWGNIWKFVNGINIWGNGSLRGGEPYICSDFNFSESKNSDNYVKALFTIANKHGFISAMGYSYSYDWLFLPSETNGNTSLPVGDCTYVSTNLSGYRIALLGGTWHNGANAGSFCWHLNNGVGSRGRDIGGRLVYIPTRDSDTYNAAIEAWKAVVA